MNGSIYVMALPSQNRVPFGNFSTQHACYLTNDIFLLSVSRAQTTLSQLIIWLKMKFQLGFPALDWQFNFKIIILNWGELSIQFKIVVLSWIINPMQQTQIGNMPILPGAFLTFASKSSIDPSYADHGPYTPWILRCWTGRRTRTRNEETPGGALISSWIKWSVGRVQSIKVTSRYTLKSASLKWIWRISVWLVLREISAEWVHREGQWMSSILSCAILHVYLYPETNMNSIMPKLTFTVVTPKRKKGRPIILLMY